MIPRFERETSFPNNIEIKFLFNNYLKIKSERRGKGIKSFVSRNILVFIQLIEQRKLDCFSLL